LRPAAAFAAAGRLAAGFVLAAGLRAKGLRAALFASAPAAVPRAFGLPAFFPCFAMAFILSPCDGR
jgi:hypothetical protein